MQPEKEQDGADTQGDTAGFYYRPEIMRLIVALDDGPEDTAEIVSSAGYDETTAEEALEQLHYRWIVDRNEDGYVLTNNGTLLAMRIRDLCSLLYRAQHEGEVSCLPPAPALCDAGQDELARIAALEDPASAAEETKVRLVEKGYGTELADEIVASIGRYVRTVAVIERFNAFFQIHSLEGLPESSLATIDELTRGELICDIPVNFKQGLAYFHELIQKGRRLHGVSTWSLPSVAATIWDRVIAGAEVELVITPELAVPLWQEEIVKKGRDPAAFPNLRFYVCTVPVMVGLTVTDRALSLGLFLSDGKTYDRIHDLLCFTPEAVEWGERLFEYYRERSVPIEKYFSGPNRPTASCR